MILGFKPQFRDPILLGTKIHTIRMDEKKRWKVGNKIHFATDVRTSKMEIFMKGEVKAVQEIQFFWNQDYSTIYGSWFVRVYLDGENITNSDKLDNLIKADGFTDRNEFFSWPAWYRQNFTGKLIHWTDFKY